MTQYRDYWIYQNRRVAIPWAINVFKTWEKGDHDNYELGFTIYSENIDNPTHSKTVEGLRGNTTGYYVDEILAQLVEISDIDNEDKVQLEGNILDILIRW